MKKNQEYQEVYKTIIKNIKNESLKATIKEDIFWYINSANKYKNIYRRLNTLHIISMGVTPLIAILGNENPIWVTIPSTLTTISFGFLKLFSPKKKWQRYRETAETLKDILLQHSLNSQGSNNKDLEIELGKTIKNIVLSENKEWQNDHKEKKKT